MTEFAAASSGVDVLERELEEHRAELTGFCYRMLGSPFEAEDAVQETIVRGWRALDRFEGRAALRSWLFGIATNVCIDMLNARRRRALPMELGRRRQAMPCPARALPEHLWVGPVHDDRVVPSNGDPAEVAVARESIRLAFVAALQHLTPKQRAALILARRAAVEDERGGRAPRHQHRVGGEPAAPRTRRAGQRQHGRPRRSVDDAAARGLSTGTSRRSSAYDVDALVALLHEDVTLSMPPYPLWLRGIDAVRTCFGTIADACRNARFLPVAANGSPGLAVYKPTGPSGRLRGVRHRGDRAVRGQDHRDPRLPRPEPVRPVRRPADTPR